MDSLIESVYYSDAPSGGTHHHHHDCHQLLFIRRGRIAVTVDGVETEAGEGDIVISNRFENHAIRVLSEPYERYLLRLRPEALPPDQVYSFLTVRPRGFRNPVPVGGQAEAFASLFRALIAECESESRFASQMRQSLVTQLLVGVCRLEEMDAWEFERDSVKLVLSLQREFEEHYREPYTLSAISERYHVSPSSLSHLFKALAGVSVMEYLCSCRMAAAKKYLIETQWRIGEIVEACGFTDSANFSRTFRQRTGMTPSAFRRRYR